MNDIFIYIFVALITLVILFLLIGPKGSNTAWKSTVTKKLNELENHSIDKYIVVEIDKLLDFALKNYPVRGQTLGDRLKNAKKLFERDLYNAIWQSHKLRNQIVHEIDFQPSQKDIQIALESTKKGIRKLL